MVVHVSITLVHTNNTAYRVNILAGDHVPTDPQRGVWSGGMGPDAAR